MRATRWRGLTTPFPLISDNASAYTTGVWAAAAWPTANKALFKPFAFPEDAHMATMQCYCGTSSGNFDLGVFLSDSTGMPSTKIASLGSTGTSGSAINSWTPSGGIWLQAGVVYYFGMWCSNTTATFVRKNVQFAVNAGGWMQTTSLGTSFVSPAVGATAGSAYEPLLVLKFDNLI